MEDNRVQCCSESDLPQPPEPTVHQILFLGRHIRNITGENKQGYLCSSIILSPLRNITPPNTMAEENKRIEPYEMVGKGCSLIKQRLKVRKHQEDQFRPLGKKYKTYGELETWKRTVQRLRVWLAIVQIS